MNNNQPTYNQPLMQGQGQQPPMAPQGPMMPPQGGMMPPPQMPPMHNRPAPRGWRGRWMRRFGMDTKAASLGVGELTLPSWFAKGSFAFFIVSFVACTLVLGHNMPLLYACYSVISVIIFLFGSMKCSQALKSTGNKKFVKTVFSWALGLRLIWVIFSYAYYNPTVYGIEYGYGDDIGAYLDVSKDFVRWLRGDTGMSLSEFFNTIHIAIDDTGNSFWMALLYTMSFETSDIFLPFLGKAFLSAYSCVCIYHVAQRHFDEGVARIAALLMCFNPYLLFWCATLLKETEMVFLCCVFVDQTDKTIGPGNKLTFKGLLPGLLAGSTLFFFRSALAIVAFLSIMVHIVFVSQKVMSRGKKIILGLLIGSVVLVGMGERIRVQSQSLIEDVQSGQQKSNMEYRATRKDAGGRQQTFAKYAGAAVFAPLIFTIPFPTFNMADEGQIVQMELSGAYYIKNILSFFVIIVMIMMLISGEWRRHVFILAYTLGYLLVLVMSNFAQSGRFHMPVWPMLMLFAAYGIQIAKTNMRIRRWFPIVLVLEVIACLAWNWFKLRGRGMI